MNKNQAAQSQHFAHSLMTRLCCLETSVVLWFVIDPEKYPREWKNEEIEDKPKIWIWSSMIHWRFFCMFHTTTRLLFIAHCWLNRFGEPEQRWIGKKTCTVAHTHIYTNTRIHPCVFLGGHFFLPFVLLQMFSHFLFLIFLIFISSFLFFLKNRFKIF